MAAGAVNGFSLSPRQVTVAGHVYNVVKPLSTDSGAEWKGVTNAYWELYRGDSTHLSIPMFSTQWDLTFRVQSDSVRGQAWLAIGDGFKGPYSVMGVRISCHT